jgi:lipid II:glycine glycyltransferase (peptidoglycan interpeptide bridge formation enzyme)
LLEDYLSVESDYLLAIDENDNIQGVLPLMKKEGKFGIIVNSLPFYGSNGGILSKSKEAFELLLDEYNRISNEVSASTYITNTLQKNIPEEKIEYDLIDKRIGQWTYINYDYNIEEEVMKSFHSKTRNMVRKAIKENIEVEIDNTQIDFLYEVHYENITSIGGKAKEKRFFELIGKHFEKGKDYNIYIAKLKGKKIAAILFFYYNRIVEYWTPAVLREYRSYQPTSLIIYIAMIDACRKGYKLWNWGGTWLTQHGVYLFKKRFGAVDKEYKYFIKINNKDIFCSSREELLREYDNFYVIPFDKLKG